MKQCFRPPKIVLEKSKGMSLHQLMELKQDLQVLAEKLKGEVMVFELATHVEVSDNIWTCLTCVVLTLMLLIGNWYLGIWKLKALCMFQRFIVLRLRLPMRTSSQTSQFTSGNLNNLLLLYYYDWSPWGHILQTYLPTCTINNFWRDSLSLKWPCPPVMKACFRCSHLTWPGTLFQISLVTWWGACTFCYQRMLLYIYTLTGLLVDYVHSFWVPQSSHCSVLWHGY